MADEELGYDQTEDDEPEEDSLVAVLEEVTATPAVQLFQTEDGFLVDVETGVVHGHVDDATPDLPFVIDDEDKANWALKLKSDIEGRKAGLLIQKAALNAQMDAVIARQTRKEAWWYFRFETDLTRFARTQLRGRSKTAQFAWGSVSFRNSAGTTQIVSPEEALEYCRVFAPHVIKVKESVGVKDVLAAVAAASAALEEEQAIPGFIKSTGPQETITISTGVLMIEGSKRR